MAKKKYRVETDSIGTKKIPLSAYYGIQTARAVDNFPITGVSIAHYPQLLRSLAYIKRAAAKANHSLGLLNSRKKRAIAGACAEIIAGSFHSDFVVDVIQGGAGTSTNMNANEVIANRGLELLGKKRGEYDSLHPLNDVNLSQSTNDVYPTAVKLAAYFLLEELAESVEYSAEVFDEKSIEFSDVLTMGRTQLQDAVPMMLGQSFSAYAVTLREDIQRIGEAMKLLAEMNLGATAIGTGINTPPGYAEEMRKILSADTGIQFITAPDLVEATQDTGVFVFVSSILKRLALKLSKISDDLRLLSSGPIAGFGEIMLPPMQAGSSIMPGKVNPVIPEAMNQISFRVIGNDLTVTLAAASGQLQLNAFEPIIALSIFESARMLKDGCRILADRCVRGITADAERCRANVERSPGLATLLNPFIGYERAASIAKECLKTGRPVYDLVLEKGWMDKKSLDNLMPMHTTVTSRRRNGSRKENSRLTSKERSRR
ncbi:MAG: aspartate ammonia-lyase [Ignavibacteriales bacterium]|nr:aspartate ammonia-lyase [Ignavibacteriales bacterium]